MGGTPDRMTVPVTVTLVDGPVIAWAEGKLGVTGLRAGNPAIVVARLAIDSCATVPRDSLADAIWDEQPPDRWQASLRNLIAAVRQWLAGAGFDSWLVSAGDGYRLELPPGSAVDLNLTEREAELAEAELVAGEAPAALARAERALAALSGEVLPGAQSRWIETLRSGAGMLELRLLRVAGEAALRLGDTARAERVARRLVAAEPLREEGHRLLMRALRAAGNSAQALVAFDACRRTLAGALGTAPSPDTESLFIEILGERQAEQDPVQVRRVPFAAAGPLLLAQRGMPFAGRGGALEQLDGWLAAARAGGPIVASVHGEPGIGKTRLAAELAGRAHAAGMSVLYGRADDRIEVAYAPLLEALGAGLAAIEPAMVTEALGEHAGVMGRLLPSLSPGRVPGERASGLEELERWRIERAIIAALRLLAVPDGALLVLDDMQWASRLELAVIEAIGGEAGLPVLILALARSAGDLSGLSTGSGRLLALELEPLSVAELAELAQMSSTAGGTDEAGAVAERLRELSGGNPLLATELLRGSREGLAAGRSARLDGLVRERLAGLSAAVESVLSIAAVAGFEFDPRVVAAASPAPDEEAARALRAAQDAQLLVPGTRHPGWLAFRHALVRDSLLQTISASASADLHRRIGIVLEPQTGADPEALVDAAYHFGAASGVAGWRRAVRYGLPVARAAYDAGVYEDVPAVAGRALEVLAGGGDPDPDARLDLEILLGAAQRALGDPAAHQTLHAALAGSRERGDAARLADAALAFTDTGAASGEAYVDDTLLEVYEDALAAIGARDERRRALLLGHLAGAYAWARSERRATEIAGEALALARRLDDPATMSRVLTTTRRALTGLGRPEQAQALERELLSLAEHFEDPGQLARTLLWQYESAIRCGEGDRLESLLARAGDAVALLRMGNYHHSLAYGQASLALLRGELERAERFVARAAEIGHERGVEPFVVEAIEAAQLFAVRREQGRAGEAEDAVRRVFDATAMPAWSAMLALLEFELGRGERVLAMVDRALDAYTLTGVTMAAPFGLLAQLAEPVAACGDRERATRIYDAIAARSGQGGFVAHFTGPVDYHLGVLGSVIGRGAEAERHLTAAAEFSRRLGAPLWVSRCQAALASG